jgi:hypothetical protein
MLVIILLLLNFISSGNGEIHCRTTAWWVLQPFSKSSLQSFLSKSEDALTFNTSNPLASFMKPDEHPVYFEFNQQNKCQQSSLPPLIANATEQTFVEFKLQIPYLIRKGKTVMLKPLLYQNSVLNTAATRLVYGLAADFVRLSPLCIAYPVRIATSIFRRPCLLTSSVVNMRFHFNKDQSKLRSIHSRQLYFRSACRQ